MRLGSCHCCGLIQWADAGRVCARCETPWASLWSGPLRNRLAVALCFAALILYFPAITWKFLRIEQLGQAHDNNLIQGVRTLFVEGEWLVGGIVLVFSIILPIVKLTALLVLCQTLWQMAPRHRAITYRAVEQLGRWGMLDVLLVAVMVAFVKLSGLVEFGAGPGLVVFAIFVLTSLCASLAFDPHCLWAEASDAGGTTPVPVVPPPASPSIESGYPQSQPPRRGSGWLTALVWLIPITALAGVGTVIVNSWWHRPREIIVTFEDGHGLQHADELRYHGIAVGEVTTIHLGDDARRVEVTIQLTPDGHRLAREGARIWIVRPQFDLTGIAGLETIVGSNFLQIHPGEPNGPIPSRFQGLEVPPLPDLDTPGGIEVLLHSPEATGLHAGAGVYYRRVRIGGVVSAGLSPDFQQVEARVYIRPEYRQLIREKTVFWNMSGVRFQGGLTELSFRIGPVDTLVKGGIGVAVPPDAGVEIGDGYRFPFHDRYEEEWTTWKPPLDAVTIPHPRQPPKLLAAKLEWQHDGYFQNPLRTRTGWLLPDAGRLRGPVNLLSIPEGTIANTARLSIGDVVFDEARLRAATAAEPKPLTDPALVLDQPVRWRTIEAGEDCFLVTGGGASPLFLSATKFQREGAGWTIDPELPLNAHHHGGALVAVQDEAVLGIVTVDGQRFAVETFGDERSE